MLGLQPSKNTSNAETKQIGSQKWVRNPQNTEEKTFAGKVLYRTKNGYALVKKGTVTGFKKLKEGTKTGIGHLKTGVSKAINKTVNLTKRSIGTVKNLVTPKEK